MKPHKHAEVIKAWADGHPIQIRNSSFSNPVWTDCNPDNIRWEDDDHIFRIKPVETRIELENGKYTVIHENGENLRALRHGEHWVNRTGDNLVLALVNRIEELEEQVKPKQTIKLSVYEVNFLIQIWQGLYPLPSRR